MTIPDPKKCRLDDLSDAELRPLIERFFEDPEELREDAEISEAERIARLRIETKRHIANYNRDMRTAAFVPICTVHGKNPLYDCVESETTCKKVKLHLRSRELETKSLDATIGFAEKAFDDINDSTEDAVGTTEPKVVLPSKSTVAKVEAEIRLAAENAPSFDGKDTSRRKEGIYHWFTLDVDLPSRFSIIAAELYPNPQNKPIEEFLTGENLTKELSDSRLALFTCRPIDGTTNRYELFTRAFRERLIDLKSVFVLRIKEAQL